MASYNKKITIASSTLSHLQAYVPSDWSIVSDEDSTEFSVAEEQYEYVPPTSTNFDYALDDDQDANDTGIPNFG